MRIQNITVNADYRIEIDGYNHTLLRRNDNTKKGWDTVGYYSTVANALKRLARHDVLNSEDCTLVEYAQGVLAKANEVCATGRPST